MAQRKSNNKYYRSEDVARPVNALKEIMGLTGNADANYLTNLGKVSRLEGTELDNKKKRDVARLIQEAIASTTDPVKRAGLAHMQSFADSGLGEQRWQTLPALVEKGRSEAATAKSEAGVAEMIRNLAQQIDQHGIRPDPAVFEGGPAGGSHLFADAIKRSAGDFENLVRKYRAIGGKGDAHKTAGQQEALVQSDLGVGESVMNYNDASRLAAQNVGEARVKEIEQRTAKTLSDMNIAKDIGHENVNKIRQGVLDLVNESNWKQKNLEQRNLLIQKYIKSEAQRLKKITAEASQEELKLEALPDELSLKRERLRQLKRKESELADQARLDTLARPKLLELKKEIAELEKGIKEQTKGKVEAQKERAIDLAEMSELEKKALPDEILAKATKLTNENLKLEEQIKLAQARTGDVNMGRSVKILQKALLNNKLAIQKLLAPHQVALAEAKAKNEAGRFAQQTALKMIPPAKADAPLPPKGGIDNFDMLTGFGVGTEDVPDMPAKPYNKMYGDIMELADSGKLKNIDVKNAQGVAPRTQILKSMIQQLGINKTQATQVLEEWLKELLPAPEE